MEINIHSREQEFYRFSTDDFALIEIGIGSYTISSLENFLKTNNGTMSDDLNDFFTGETSNSLLNKLIGETYKGSMKIQEFDLTNKKYKETTSLSEIISLDANHFPLNKFTPPSVSEMSRFLQNWNRVQRGSFENSKQSRDGYIAVAHKIQASASGCITFQATFNVLGRSRTSTIRLHLLESSDAESSRSISFKGSPIITNPPETAYNAVWGYRNTIGSDPGAYFSPSQGGADNPENTVSAPMDMAFDPSVGKWQSGTQQMLMTLLDDVDPASVPNLSREEWLAATRADVYDAGTESPYKILFTGPYKAIPLSSENGNPHLFGPDYRDGCSGDNKAIVKVVNRMNISYKAGSVVVCSKMLGDSGLWTIVGGLGKEGAEAERKLNFGNFEYQQHIVPANLYFTDPISAVRLYPDEIALKARLSYYLKLFVEDNEDITGGAGSDSKLFLDTAWLNLAATKIIDSDTETPIQQLKRLYGSDGSTIKNQKEQITNDSKIGGINALDFFNANYCANSLLFARNATSYEVVMPPNEHQKEYALPKNIRKRSAETVPGILTNAARTGGDQLSTLQVPVFWGMLFPDGYKTETVRDFQPLVSGTDIYKDDPNLSELTCGATECVYDFRDQLKNLRFSRFLGVDAIPRPPQGDEEESQGNFSTASLVRRTGGLYRPLINLERVINDPVKLLNYVDMVPNNGNGAFYAERIKYAPQDEEGEGGAIYGAEPLNPGKIQFSSMSLESLYFASDIQEGRDGSPGNAFRHLYSVLTNPGYLNQTITFSYGESAKFRDYAKFLFYPGGLSRYASEGFTQEAELEGETNLDALNKYNIGALSLNKSYSYNNVELRQKILSRHRAPIGTLMGGGVTIAPNIESKGRVPAIPVLTCKSTITSSAASLLFTCDQSIGVIQKRTISAGQGPTVTIFPIGGGIGWSTPGQSPQTWEFVQWGGDNDIDSFGTTALHVRIFEHVPPNQLIYLGPIFTPLHFNPSEPSTKFVIAYDENNNPIASGTDIPNPLATDFKVPTNTEGTVYKLDDTVVAQSPDEENGLAPFEDWKTNTIRRGKMLTKGGFAYFKPVIMVNSASVDEGGTGYKKDDKLLLLDGSEIIVKDVEDDNNKKGIITNIEFKPNFDKNLTKTSTNGYRTIENVSANGGSGSGAKFKFEFIIKYDIGHDPEPKESTPSNGLLLTSPNNRGESGHITSQVNTSVELVKSNNNKGFDIFYFYHNDPSHYSLDDFLSFSNGAAQYVVSEVKAQ